MAAAGPDEDGSHRLHGKALAVEFDEAFAFEHEVNLGELFVVVRLRVGLDVHEMNRRDGIVRRGEGAARPAARAARGLDVVELGDGVVFHGDESALAGGRAKCGRRRKA